MRIKCKDTSFATALVIAVLAFIIKWHSEHDVIITRVKIGQYTLQPNENAKYSHCNYANKCDRKT